MEAESEAPIRLKDSTFAHKLVFVGEFPSLISPSKNQWLAGISARGFLGRPLVPSLYDWTPDVVRLMMPPWLTNGN